METILNFNNDCIDKEVAEKLSKEVSSYIIEQLKNNMETIEERARLAAWQIFEEIGLSKHSVDRVSEIIIEKMSEQKDIDIDKACEWLRARNVLTEASIEGFRKAMEE